MPSATVRPPWRRMSKTESRRQYNAARLRHDTHKVRHDCRALETLMQDVLHALTFIDAAGAIFIGVVLAEAWYWKRRGAPEKYALNDTVSNMTMGPSYKLVDGVFVALQIGRASGRERVWPTV